MSFPDSASEPVYVNPKLQRMQWESGWQRILFLRILPCLCRRIRLWCLPLFPTDRWDAAHSTFKSNRFVIQVRFYPDRSQGGPTPPASNSVAQEPEDIFSSQVNVPFFNSLLQMSYFSSLFCRWMVAVIPWTATGQLSRPSSRCASARSRSPV